MPRAARVVAAGVPHHLTQRGNNRQDVFFVDADRRAYLEQLRQDCRVCGVRLLGYCLMTNHVHLIAVPEASDSFARALRHAHAAYSQGFNRRYRRSGHLWQNRFYSCPLGPDHLLAALAYVDLNPVRAGMVGDAAEYPWSSARGHLANEADEFVTWTCGGKCVGTSDGPKRSKDLPTQARHRGSEGLRIPEPPTATKRS